MVDLLWRVGFRVAHQLRRFYYFVVRPKGGGVYVALWVDDDVLMIKNSYRRAYAFPCGGVKRHESCPEAAVRELREEVGVVVSAGDLRPVGKFETREDFLRDSSLVFEVELSERPALSVDCREVVRAEFVPWKEARELPIVPVVEQYLALKASS